MRTSMAVFACVLAAGIATAGSVFGDEGSDLRGELDALKRKVAEQERALRAMEGKSQTSDEVEAAVARYLAQTPDAKFVGGADGGKAGFPLGKKPFISEGPNKLEIGARWQVRYEAFLYSSDAVGVVGDGATPENFTVTDAAPRDRSGFELERLLLDFGGTIFCPDISYLMQFDFDTDSGSGIQKRFAYLDWKYSGEHHLRAGADRAPYGYEPNNSSGALAFVDRSIVGTAFDIGWHTGVTAWGYFGPCDCPKQFLYKVQLSNGEGRIDQEGGSAAGSVFNRDARDTYSDQPMISGMLEWVITCDEFKWDEVDHRDCDKRCQLQAAVGVSGYYENDDDTQHNGWGNLTLRSTGRAERTGLNAWFRAAWQGWTFLAEGFQRSIDYTSGAPEQTDVGLHGLLHYRFADSNWGLGVRAGVIWIDDDYTSLAIGQNAPVEFADTISEFGVVVNYFFWNHNNKLTADVNWVQDNSGVNTTTQGYMWGTSRGVVIEDGVMLRVQWQVMF